MRSQNTDQKIAKKKSTYVHVSRIISNKEEAHTHTHTAYRFHHSRYRLRMPQTWKNTIIYVYPANCLYGMLRKTSGSVAAGCFTSLSSSSISSLFAGEKAPAAAVAAAPGNHLDDTTEKELHRKYDVLERVQKAS